MQTAADVSEIPKTVQSDVTFILNVLSESSIHFSWVIIIILLIYKLLTTYSFYKKQAIKIQL